MQTEIIKDLMKEYKRPFYIYDEKVIGDQIQELKTNFPEFEFLYSIKTNPNKDVIKFISQNDIGSDSASKNEVFKSKVKAFKQERNQQNLIAVLKMLSGRKFLLPSVCNVEDPFEKLENGNVRLKEGTVFNPAFLTSTDKKVFLPIFTDEESMVQKSPSGVLLKLNFEQCVTVVYDEKNPVEAVVINPFTENMIIGIDLLKMVFKEKKKEEKQD